MPDVRSQRIKDSGVTPARRTHLIFNSAETVPTEPFFLHHREGRFISPSSVTNCIRLKSGYWSLAPANSFLTLHETTAGHSGTMRLTDFSRIAELVEVPRQRKYTELTGLTISSAVATQGDYWLKKRVAAGATWGSEVPDQGESLAMPADVASPNYAMKRVAVAREHHPSNQGYYFRLLLGGADEQTPDLIAHLRFGGALVEDATAPTKGFGAYLLSIRGDGTALLHEKLNGAWVKVAEWRYATPRDGTASSIGFRIIPHPAGIEFASVTQSGDTLPEILTEVAHDAVLLATGDMSPVGIYLHPLTNRGAAAAAPAPGHQRPATGPGRPAIWIREDLNPLFQLSRIYYPPSGQIVDRPLIGPGNVGTDHVLRLNLIGHHYYPGDGAAVTTATGVLQRADGTALTSATENFDWNGTTVPLNGWQVPPAPHHIRAVITLGTSEAEGQRWHSPYLVAYDVLRNGHLATVSPGTTEHQGLVGLSVTGPGYQMEHESARLLVEDPTDALAFLRERGRVPVVVETEYDATDSTKRATVFRGYVGRATGSLKGKQGRTWPSEEWRDLNLECVGMWDRLVRRLIKNRYNFGDDSSTPGVVTSNARRPWYVTDIIRFLLNAEGGLPFSQIDVPHDPQRVFYSPALPDQSLMQPNPGTPLLAYCQMLAASFLNQFLVWDDNAGASGKMRLRRAPRITDTPVWAFVTTLPTGNKLAYRSASYGTGTSPILGPDWKTPFESFVVPPEGSSLRVLGRKRANLLGLKVEQLERVVRNPDTANASSLDYYPHHEEILYVDLTLEDQASVDFIARREMNAVLRAHRFARFTSEYVLIDAAALDPATYTHRLKRPLLPGDVVTVDGEKWAIENVNPIWTHDQAQLQYGEMRLLREEQTLF